MGIFKQLSNVMSFADEATQKDLEAGNKPYLILLRGLDEEDSYQDDSYQEFEAVAMRGRESVYDHFMQQLGAYDLLHSYVISGKIPLGKEVTLYTFLRLCREQYFQNKPGADTDELNSIVYETTPNLSDQFDIDAFYYAEINRRTKE